MQNKILWKKFEEDFWNWKTHQVVVMGPLSSMNSDYSQSFFPDRWKTAWGQVSGSCLAGSLQSSTLQVGWIPLDWESPKRKGQCLILSSYQSQCQPLFSRQEVTEVRPRAPLGCLLSSVRGCTHRGAWAGWVDWLHCRASYQRIECGGACQGAGSGRCLINKKYSCFYIEQVWQPALFLPEPRHKHFVRATVTQLGRMFFQVTYWHHPSVHSDGPAPSFAFSQGLPPLPPPPPPSYSRSNKDQLWFWELLKNSKTNTFFSLLSQTVSCSPELESHVYNASNLCARFCTETPLGLVLQARLAPELWHSAPWCPVPEETVLSFLDCRQLSFAGNSDFRTYLLRRKFPVLDLRKARTIPPPWPSPDGDKVFH